MSLLSDLAWKQLDLIKPASVANQVARYALGVNFEALPKEVVHYAKRCLLDALGCCIGGIQSPGYQICEEAVKEFGGPEEATVIGSGFRTSAHNAALVNSFIERFLDYNDVGGGSHGEDAIPAILAVGEKEKATGRDLLAAIVVCYEIGARFIEARPEERKPGQWMSSGWNKDTRAGLSMPATLGKLMGLNEDQIANAIGTCFVGNFVLEAADTRGQEFSMRKNLRFGWVSCGAIQSCILAKKGFTGQVRVIEGEMGVNEVLYGNKMDLERLLDFRGWRILNTRHKFLCSGAAEQGHIGCTLAIVTENNLKPEDIAAVTIYVRPSADLLRPALPFNYPRNAETADHSAIYTTAIAITERALGPFSYEPQKFSDPVVLDLIEKITAKPDPAMGEITKGFYTSSGFQGKSEIVTKDGRRFQKHIVNPHGFGDDPLTDKELEDKFSEMALKYMDKGQVQKIFDTIWNADKLDDVNNLMRLMVFKSSASAKRGG